MLGQGRYVNQVRCMTGLAIRDSARNRPGDERLSRTKVHPAALLPYAPSPLNARYGRDRVKSCSLVVVPMCRAAAENHPL